MTDLQREINDLLNKLFEEGPVVMQDLIGSVPLPFSENSCLYEGHNISFLQMCETFSALLNKPFNVIPPAGCLEVLACFLSAVDINSFFLSGKNITQEKIIERACAFDYAKQFDKDSIFRTSKTKVAFEAYVEKLNRVDPNCSLELAAYALAEFVRIKPFKIANGHCARLIMNYVLLRNDIPWIFFEAGDKAQYDEALALYKQSRELGAVVPLIAQVVQRQIRPWLKDCTQEEQAWRDALVNRCMDVYKSKKLLNFAKLHKWIQK